MGALRFQAHSKSLEHMFGASAMFVPPHRGARSEEELGARNDCWAER